MCHVDDGGGNSLIALNFGTKLENAHLLDERPIQDSLGIADARLIAPGDPKRSVIYQRVATRGPGQMPPTSSNMVDARAVKLLHEWITQLKPRAQEKVGSRQHEGMPFASEEKRPMTSDLSLLSLLPAYRPTSNGSIRQGKVELVGLLLDGDFQLGCLGELILARNEVLGAGGGFGDVLLASTTAMFRNGLFNLAVVNEFGGNGHEVLAGQRPVSIDGGRQRKTAVLDVASGRPLVFVLGVGRDEGDPTRLHRAILVSDGAVHGITLAKPGVVAASGEQAKPNRDQGRASRQVVISRMRTVFINSHLLEIASLFKMNE